MRVLPFVIEREADREKEISDLSPWKQKERKIKKEIGHPNMTTNSSIGSSNI